MNVCVCVHNTVKKSQIIYVTVTLVTIIKKSFIYVIIWKRIVQYFIQDAAFSDSQIFFLILQYMQNSVSNTIKYLWHYKNIIHE